MGGSVCGRMASNSKNEGLIGSEELGGKDTAASLDATGVEIGLFQGQGI